MLKWVLERVAGTGDYTDTPIGRVPTPDAIDTTGLDLDGDVVAALVSVDPESWRQELPQIAEHYDSLGERLPDELRDELNALEKRLAAS